MTPILTNAVELAEELIQFFGCGLNTVNPILLRMASKNRPEWLRNCPSLKMLPRWSSGNFKNTVIVPKRISPNEISDRIIWIIEELQCEWTLTTDGFNFADSRESIHFKLRWG